MRWRADMDLESENVKGDVNVKHMFINTTYIMACPLGDRHVYSLIAITRHQDVGVQLHLN